MALIGSSCTSLSADRMTGQVDGETATSKAAAAKVLTVLEAFSRCQEEVGVAELARTADLPKSTTHRMLGFLCDEGFVKSAAGRYSLTTKVARLSTSGPNFVKTEWQDRVLPYLTDLHDAIKQPVLLVVRSGNTAQVVKRVCGSRTAEFTAQLGNVLPLHCTAAGKLLLAHPCAPAEPKLALNRYTKMTITDKDWLERELAAVRVSGMATDANEWRVGVTSLAVALRGSASTPPAVISVVGLSACFDVRAVAPQLRRVAHRAALSMRGSQLRSIAT